MIKGFINIARKKLAGNRDENKQAMTVSSVRGTTTSLAGKKQQWCTKKDVFQRSLIKTSFRMRFEN